MLQKINKLIVGVIIGLCTYNIGQAQVGESPFSIRGIGELKSTALIPNIGMGGVGVSVPYSWYLNNMNPAFLYKNNLVTFESGMMVEQNRFSNAEYADEHTNAGISYIVLGIPVVLNKWTLAAGWTPYSSLNYNSSAILPVQGIDGVNANYNYMGSGGLNQAYISNGFKLNKNFSLGFRANYIFGNVINETVTSVIGNGDIGGFETTYFDRASFSDFSFQGALGFTKPLNSKTRLNVGATYDISTNIGGRELGRLERTGSSSIAPDTILNNQGSIRLPSIFNGGISLQRNNRWTVGSEIRIQNWAQYRGFDGESGNLQNSVRVSLGGELVPDPTSIDNYLKRATYRAGTYFERTPFVVDGQQVNDVGITLGTSLPVWGFSSINMALELGQRGAAGLRDQYFRVYFGITFNDKPWIKLPKYD